jgi:N6-adenosine-specific RNA methylase IME4
MMNVGRRSVQRAAEVQEKGAPELKQAVEQGKIAVSTAAEIADALSADEQAQVAKLSDEEILAKAKTIRKEKNDKRRAERVAKIAEKAAGNTGLSTVKQFPVIYMDPPTKFSAGDSDRSTENHYPTMTEEELARLPVTDLATYDAVLFIWTTVPWLRKTLRLIEAWGFEYVSEYVWDKQHMSLGFWARNQHETLLVAKRGNIPAPDPSLLERSLFREQRTDHSAKPAFFRDMIGRYYGELPKVELFPRGELPEGWHGWGNEARLTAQQTLGIEGDKTEEEQAA